MAISISLPGMETAFAEFHRSVLAEVQAQLAVQTAKLDARQRALDERERALEARERLVNQPVVVSRNCVADVEVSLVDSKPIAERTQERLGNAPQQVPDTSPLGREPSSLLFGNYNTASARAEEATCDLTAPAVSAETRGAAAPRPAIVRANSEGPSKRVSFDADSDSMPAAHSPGGVAASARSAAVSTTGRGLLFGSDFLGFNAVRPAAVFNSLGCETLVKASPGPIVQTDSSSPASIDRSCPGRASQLRNQFEKQTSPENLTPRKSWAPQMKEVALPNGAGTTKIHVGGDVGGSYKARTSFHQPPPPRKSISDLP